MELSNDVDEDSSVFQLAGVTSNESADGSADLRTRVSEENLGGPEPSAFIAIGHEHTEEVLRSRFRTCKRISVKVRSSVSPQSKTVYTTVMNLC